MRLSVAPLRGLVAPSVGHDGCVANAELVGRGDGGRSPPNVVAEGPDRTWPGAVALAAKCIDRCPNHRVMRLPRLDVADEVGDESHRDSVAALPHDDGLK